MAISFSLQCFRYVNLQPLYTSVCEGRKTEQLQLTGSNFHETWHERYAIGDDPKFVAFNFLRSEITTWRTRELVMWEPS
jgi:hypothetical protein